LDGLRGLVAGIHRPTHLLKALLVAGIAVAGFGATSVVPHAYPAPEEEHSLHCWPSAIIPGGTCTLTFTDEAKGEGAGQKVCFSVKTVIFACSTTNPKGQATTTFMATGSSCGSEDSRSLRLSASSQSGKRLRGLRPGLRGVICQSGRHQSQCWRMD
jgi:hypothetical protein